MPDVNRARALGGWTRAVTAKPRLTLLLALLFTALAVVAGSGVANRLSSGGWEAPDSQSSYATSALAQHFPASQPNLILLVDARGAGVDSAAVTAEGQDLARRLAADPAVTGVASYWSTHAPSLRAKNGGSAMITARLRGGDDAVATEVKRVAPAFRGTHGPVDVTIGGSAAVQHDMQSTIQADLVRAEMIAFPITLVLLVMVFGSAVAALLPLGVGIVAILGAGAVLRGVTEFTERLGLRAEPHHGPRPGTGDRLRAVRRAQIPRGDGDGDHRPRRGGRHFADRRAHGAVLRADRGRLALGDARLPAVLPALLRLRGYRRRAAGRRSRADRAARRAGPARRPGQLAGSAQGAAPRRWGPSRAQAMHGSPGWSCAGLRCSPSGRWRGCCCSDCRSSR